MAMRIEVLMLGLNGCHACEKQLSEIRTYMFNHADLDMDIFDIWICADDIESETVLKNFGHVVGTPTTLIGCYDIAYRIEGYRPGHFKNAMRHVLEG